MAVHKIDRDPVPILHLSMEETNVQVLHQTDKHAIHITVQSMVVIHPGHHGAYVVNHVAVALKEEPEVVQTLFHNIMEGSVQETLHKHKAATLITVQFTVGTQHGRAGTLVQLLAEVVHKTERDPVLTLHLSMEETNVPDLHQIDKYAIHITVQLMAHGPVGVIGEHVQ